MEQAERRRYLIDYLLNEHPREYGDVEIPEDAREQRQLLRALMNVRTPGPIGEDFLTVQDAYLKERLLERGVTDYRDLTPAEDHIYLWQGDITTLRCGAIVNAANSGMTGCYRPCHACIDNCIHTFAGVQLRTRCGEIMDLQGYEEPTGKAKLTRAYNLPSDYVLHTVGPIVTGRLTGEHERLLVSCYESCLDLAAENGIKSVAFCCISTGVFRFPAQRAAELAVGTVREYLKAHDDMDVIFNVFLDEDKRIYEKVLGLN